MVGACALIVRLAVGRARSSNCTPVDLLNRRADMLSGLVSALLVLAGGACAVAGLRARLVAPAPRLRGRDERDLFTERPLDLVETRPRAAPSAPN
jgi:hypothetical protein